MRIVKGIANLSVTIIASLILIFLGIIYFMVTIWMIKIGAGWAGFSNLDGNWVILTTGIVTGAALIGSALQH
ncbi:MAG: hypothetical protein ACLFPJ_02620 [Candidatus Woesearchaeota archaeon]